MVTQSVCCRVQNWSQISLVPFQSFLPKHMSERGGSQVTDRWFPRQDVTLGRGGGSCFHYRAFSFLLCQRWGRQVTKRCSRKNSGFASITWLADCFAGCEFFIVLMLIYIWLNKFISPYFPRRYSLCMLWLPLVLQSHSSTALVHIVLPDWTLQSAIIGFNNYDHDNNDSHSMLDQI